MNRTQSYTYGVVVFILLGSLAAYIIGVVLTSHTYNWEAIKPYRSNLFVGWLYTLGLSCLAMVSSVLVGVLLTIGQLSPFKPANTVSRMYVEFIRGMPLLVMILVGYYMIADALKLNSIFLFGVLVLSLFNGAYLAEIFRAGVESIAQNQRQSAQAIGLDTLQTYRLIIIPQAIRRVLPASTGQFANLIKDSSLLYAIAAPEFTSQVRQANSNAYTSYEGYLPLAIGYLIITIPIFLWSRWLEKKFIFD